MSLGRSQATILASTETGEARRSRRRLAEPNPNWDPRFYPTCDDLLHFAVWWVTENRGGGPDFVAEVAVVLNMLKGEVGRVTRLLESHAKLVALATDNVHRSPAAPERR